MGFAGCIPRYDEKEGLASNQVFTILQDHFGYIWIGTLNGLSRFDGYNFKNYELELEDPTSLQMPLIYAIYEDANNDLWIGGLGGLSKYNRVEDNFTFYSHPTFTDDTDQEEIVKAIMEDRAGSLLLGLVNNKGSALKKGLFYFDRSSQSIREYVFDKATLHLRPLEGKPQEQEISLDTLGTGDVQMFVRDSAGDIWFAGSAGIARINETEHKIEAYRAPELDFYSTTLRKNEDDTFWLGIAHRGLYHFDPRTTTFQFLPLEPAGNTWADLPDGHPHIQDILQIDDRHLWITASEGLIQFDTRDHTSSLIPVTTTGAQDGSESFFPSNIMKDNAGDIWIANRAGGAIRYETDASYFRTFTHQLLEGRESLVSWDAAAWVSSLFEKPDGDILVIRRFSSMIQLDDKLEQIKVMPAVPEQMIHQLHTDPQGVIWAAHSGGIHQYLPEKDEFVPIPIPEETGNYVKSVLKDQRSILWFGTYRGLFSYDEQAGIFKRYNLEEYSDLPSCNQVNLLLEDQSGNLWVGTDGGIFKYIQKENTLLRMFGPGQTQTLINHDINSLYEDQNGIIWIGTWQGGLHRYDPETGQLKVFTKKEGLPSNAIQGILGDEANDALWLSTFNGISRFDLATERFSNFGLEDGIQGKQFADRSALKTSNGLFLFGGINGMTAFRPEEVVSNLDTPKVLITDFKLFNEPVLPGAGSVLQHPIYETEQIRLQHDENDISFGFVAFQYSDPQKIKYAYKLEGFDADWRYVGTQRSATYTNLPPGSYTFRLKAANKHDIWNEEGRSVIISIAKPWWRTWWAYALYLVALGVGIWAFIQWRLYYLRLHFDREAALAAEASAKAANNAKSAFLSMVSHELRTPLTSIIGFSKLNQKSLRDRILPGIREEDHKAQKAAKKLESNLEIVATEGERLTTLINDLLDLAKIEAGKVEWKMTEVQPAELIERAAAATAALFEQKPTLKLVTEIPETLPTVTADRDRILQVLINLISNAVKFTDSGTVTLGVRLFATGKSPANPSGGGKSYTELTFFVSDTGAGIPPEHLDRIFEKFKQVDDNQAGKPKGTGLGLPICKEIVEHHGGRVWVESEPGKGSVFSFCLSC